MAFKQSSYPTSAQPQVVSHLDIALNGTLLQHKVVERANATVHTLLSFDTHPLTNSPKA
jgi:hypothetical protein